MLILGLINNIMVNQEQADLTNIEKMLILTMEQNQQFMIELNQIRKDFKLPQAKPKSGYLKRRHRRINSPPESAFSRKIKTQNYNRKIRSKNLLE